MDELLSLHPGRLHLLAAPRKMNSQLVNPLISRLALDGLVHVLDGGNCFDALGLARLLRMQTNQIEDALGRVQVSRAFTCYQMVALLAQQGDGPIPVLVLEMLDTFRDENVPAKERLRLLEVCLGELSRLAGQASVLVALSQSRADHEHLSRLKSAADYRWEFEVPDEQPPLKLF